MVGWFGWPRQRRSAGIEVSRPVHRSLRAGDAARGQGDWTAAAGHYRVALGEAPGLAHIWVQLGHALGEAGDAPAAAAAYRRSIVAGGDVGEAQLHLGHVATRTGDWASAARYYGDAARHGRDDGVASIVDRVRALFAVDPDLLRAAVLDLPFDPNDAGAEEHDGPTDGAVIAYDISDLIAHFGHYRLPTGIQRFQVEVLAHALDRGTNRSRICCFVKGRAEMIEIRHSVFRGLDLLSRSGGDARDPAWLAMLARLYLDATIAPAYRFTHGECLVNLGTSWSHHNYFLMVRNAKESHAIRFVATVFDLIPVVAPHFCVPAISQAYINWLIGAFVHADLFLAISQSTARDLARAAALLGRDDMAQRITVVPLDADFKSSAAIADTGVLARYGLSPDDYALIVSTIEPRKNHLLALQAWARLLRRHRAERIPPLVVVGRRGWLYKQVYDYLDSEPALHAKIVFIETAGDDELADLYRGCAFTVYPSLYEGWGLPVTEAMSYGKLVVVSDNSSLPEAGGRFASFFESGSLEDLVRALEQAIFDSDWRRSRERVIAAEFRPRSWQQIADSIVEQVLLPRGLADVAGDSAAMAAGQLYLLGLYRESGLWRGLDGGERLRIGDGWLWPQDDICRTAPGGATLRIMPPSGGAWRILLLLNGLARQQAPFRVAVADQCIEGSIEPGVTRWSRPIVVDVGEAARLDIRITGGISERLIVHEDGVERQRDASIGVRGVYLCPADDKRGYARVLMAGLDGDLSSINTFSRGAIAAPATPR